MGMIQMLALGMADINDEKLDKDTRKKIRRALREELALNGLTFELLRAKVKKSPKIGRRGVYEDDRQVHWATCGYRITGGNSTVSHTSLQVTCKLALAAFVIVDENNSPLKPSGDT